MARIDNLVNFVTDICNATRNKTGRTEPILLSNLDTEIESIQTGGGEPNLQDKSVTITENGTTNITADEGYDGLGNVNVTTSVSSGSTPEIGWVVNEWNEYGKPLTITTYGYTDVPRGLFDSSTTSSTFPNVKKYILNSGFGSSSTASDTFRNNTSLQEIDTSKLENNSMNLGWHMFESCTSLLSFDLTRTKGAHIPPQCFYNCTKFDIQALPNTITHIDYNAFGLCSSLSLTELPDTITEIGTYVNNMSGSAFNRCTKLALTHLPANLKYITGYYNFKECPNITISKIPDGVTGSIPSETFRACSGITTIDLNNVLTIANQAFSTCLNLQEVIAPNVTKIVSSAFYGCTKLTTISCDKAYDIGSGAFYNCISLKKINLKNTTNANGKLNSAFTNCKALVSASLNTFTTIYGGSSSNSAFSNCSSLKAIWVGSAITSSGFGRYALYGCNQLAKIYIDLPRATVEGFTYYSTKWSNNTVLSTCEVICNDDAGFITKDAFDAIDWETYTE